MSSTRSKGRSWGGTPIPHFSFHSTFLVLKLVGPGLVLKLIGFWMAASFPDIRLGQKPER